MTTAVVHAWTRSVLIAGIETPCLRVTTSHAVAQPVGTCSIEIPLPLPAHVVPGSSIQVTVSMDGVPLAKPLFTGTFRDPDKNYSTSGAIATLLCEGPNYKLTYPFETDVVYAGGAKDSPLTLSLGSTYLHLGTQTIAWYGNTAPHGAPDVDKTFTPAVDSSFLWIAGRLHGTNSYDASIGDKTIKDHSKIIVRQDGVELGRAFFPTSSEDWSSMHDYTNDSFWSDFELFIACDPPISASGGSVTVRFHSGHKPGSADYDEYEVKAVTYQTAGKTTARNIVRGLYKRAGFAAGSYSVNEVTDLGGAIIWLGGNGKVDAGQVRMAARDTPLAFINRLVGMYGFSVFDCGDGIPRCLPVRGVPAGTPVATFAEGVDCFSVRSRTDVSKVYNSVEVTGASGTDADRKKFAYTYQTASPPSNPAIPNPPGVHVLPVSSSLLSSTSRCQRVGEVQEANNTDQTFVDWETWPHAIDPARVVRVTAPTVGLSGLLFVTSIRHDLSAQGFRCSLSGWAGVATSFTEIADPNESENDAVPTAPRPSTEWRAYLPKASVN